MKTKLNYILYHNLNNIKDNKNGEKTIWNTLVKKQL